MRVTILGCGAIGEWLAAGFAAGGAEVSVLARGATLAALRARGLVLRDGAAERVLQDLEAGRRLELGPVLTARHPAPVMRGVHGLVALLERSRG
jgi:2-dehydropantoate 2-reductase